MFYSKISNDNLKIYNYKKRKKKTLQMKTKKKF